METYYLLLLKEGQWFQKYIDADYPPEIVDKEGNIVDLDKLIERKSTLHGIFCRFMAGSEVVAEFPFEDGDPKIVSWMLKEVHVSSTDHPTLSDEECVLRQSAPRAARTTKYR